MTTANTTSGTATGTTTPIPFGTLADRFDAVVGAATSGSWSRRSPCEGWTAADVVAHVVGTQRDFLRRAGLDLPEPVDVVADPVPAWTAHRATVEGLLSDPGVADRAYTSLFGESTVGAMMRDFYGFDLIVHRIDVARAMGVEDHLSDAEIDTVEAAADRFGEHLYDDGVCAPAVHLTGDPTREERLLARLGRDPRERF